MKIKNLLVAVCLLALTATALAAVNYELRTSTAEVEQEQGLYIFYRSKPMAEYEYLGTHKIKLSWDGKPKTLFNQLIRKVKDKYPDAQGVIIDNDLEKADAIKFKK